MCYIPPLRTRGEGLSVPNHRKTGHNRFVLSLLRIRSNVHNIITKKILSLIEWNSPARVTERGRKRRECNEDTMKPTVEKKKSPNAQRKTATCGLAWAKEEKKKSIV